MRAQDPTTEGKRAHYNLLRFLLARLHLDTLMEFQMETVDDIENALELLRKSIGGPRELNRAYEQALKRIESRKKNVKWPFKLLMWILHAFRPLSLDEVRHALAVKEGDRKLTGIPPDPARWASQCAGLVSVNRETNTIELDHYTIKESSESNPQTWMKDAHLEITRACLTYLTFDEFILEPITQDLSHRLDCYPFIVYATLNWGHHVRRCENEVWEMSKELLLKFLRSREFILAATQTVFRQELEPWVNRSFRLHNRKPEWLWSHSLAYFDIYEIYPRLIQKHPGKYFRINYKGAVDSIRNSTPLIVAGRVGQGDIFKHILNTWPNRANRNAQDGGCKALGIAVEKGDYTIVKYLTDLAQFQVDYNSEIRSKHGSLVRTVVANSSYHTARWLVDVHPDKIDIKAGSRFGDTSLSVAARIGNIQIAKMAVELELKQPMPSTREHFQGALWEAARAGHLEVVQLLMELGHDRIDANYATEGGTTALSGAAGNGHYDICHLLVSLRQEVVDVNALGGDGKTPLFCAIGRGREKTVELLLNPPLNRLDADLGNIRSGGSPLSFAAEQGHQSIAEKLIHLGRERVDPASRDNYGKTPLHYAAAGGYCNIMKLLLSHGVDPNCKDHFRSTPLMDAASRGHCAAFQLLLDLGPDQVDPNAADSHPIFMEDPQWYGEDDESGTPLMYAAGEGHLEVVKLLCGLAPDRVDINAVDHTDHTPLAWAIRGKHYSTAEFLLEIRCNRAPISPIVEKEAARAGPQFVELLRAYVRID